MKHMNSCNYFKSICWEQCDLTRRHCSYLETGFFWEPHYTLWGAWEGSCFIGKSLIFPIRSVFRSYHLLVHSLFSTTERRKPPLWAWTIRDRWFFYNRLNAGSDRSWSCMAYLRAHWKPNHPRRVGTMGSRHFDCDEGIPLSIDLPYREKTK